MDSRGGVAQLVRANGSYPLGQQFKSARRYHLPKSPMDQLISGVDSIAEEWFSFCFTSRIKTGAAMIEVNKDIPTRSE